MPPAMTVTTQTTSTQTAHFTNMPDDYDSCSSSDCSNSADDYDDCHSDSGSDSDSEHSVDLSPVADWGGVAAAPTRTVVIAAPPHKLLPHQVAHAEDIRQRLFSYGLCFDTSQCGMGKTVVASIVAETWEQVIVLAPNNVVPKWVELLYHRSNVIILPATATTTGTKDGATAKGLLLRKKVDGCVSYKATDFLHSLVAGGKCLLIVDEVQIVKNADSEVSLAWETVACAVLGPSGKPQKGNAVLALSNTPFETVHHVLQFMGWSFIRPTAEGGRLELDDAEAAAKSLLGRPTIEYEVAPGKRQLTLYNMWVQAISPLVSVQMKGKLPFPAKTFTTWFALPNAAAYEQYRLAATNAAKNNLGALTEALELAKVPVFVRAARSALEAGKSVVVALLHTGPIKAVRNALQTVGHSVGELHGGVDASKQQEFIRRFRDNVDRVLILNMTVAGAGVDLDDKRGDHPRVILIDSVYSSAQVVQAVGRVSRADTKSQAEAHVVMACGPNGERDVREDGILAAIVAKTKVMKDTVKHSSPLPAEFPELVEVTPVRPPAKGTPFHLKPPSDKAFESEAVAKKAAAALALPSSSSSTKKRPAAAVAAAPTKKKQRKVAAAVPAPPPPAVPAAAKAKLDAVIGEVLGAAAAAAAAGGAGAEPANTDSVLASLARALLSRLVA